MRHSLGRTGFDMATIIASPDLKGSFSSDAYVKDSASSKSEETLVTEPLDIPLPPLSNPPNEILSLDKDTPDNHVPRDSRLIRLTGAHPFNVEPPLTDLFDEGALINVGFCG
jgi:nitrate reductase (NAD(P)H)